MGMETPGQKIAREAFDAFDKWCQEHLEELEDLTIEQRVDKYAFYCQINLPSSRYRRP